MTAVLYTDQSPEDCHIVRRAASSRRVPPPKTSTSWIPKPAETLLSPLTAAIVRPFGDQRGVTSARPDTNAISRAALPSASATPITEPDRPPDTHRENPSRRPSGDQTA